ncbi:MAG: acyl-homoserine-lactone synthase [Oleiphilaceae bacterium]|nr:acyl-homoserine-lactone synthase [Oleiphilaceae bacterium]
MQNLPQELWQRLERYRFRVFVQHLGWDMPHVPASVPGGERDQFDQPDTLYVIALSDNDGEIIGCARLLPTLRPYLLREVFPMLLGDQPLPSRADLWELSRFAALDLSALSKRRQGQVSSPHARKLIRAVMGCVARRGGHELITASPVAMARLLRHNGIAASCAGPVCLVDGERLCAFRMSTKLGLLNRRHPVSVV